MSFLYFSFANQYLLGVGFSFPIVLVSKYKLSLCHTPIKPDLLGFLGIGVFVCELRDHMITRLYYNYQALKSILSLYYNYPNTISETFSP